MHLGKAACKLALILFATNFREVVGHLFFNDFSKKFGNTNPVFISTDDFDLDLKGTNQNSALSLIRYTTNQDEEQVQQSPDNHTMLNRTTLLFAPNLPGIKWNVTNLL